jgi:hypothetical protein
MYTELIAVRGKFGGAARSRKLELLQSLAAWKTSDVRLIERLHAVGLFTRAFPDDAEVHAAAGDLLKAIAAQVSSAGVRQRRLLADSGIAGTSLTNVFWYDTSSWLATRYPTRVRVAWRAFDKPERLDPVLHPLLHHAELPAWDEGETGTQEWVVQAIGDLPVTDLFWIAEQIRRSGSRRRLLSDLYDTAEVPVQWELAEPAGSKTFNEIPWLAQPRGRTHWRRAPTRFRVEIQTPVPGITRLSRSRASDVINAARVALAVRLREVYAMTYANPDEVYLAPVGDGVHVAVLGVLPERRFSVEGNYGYVIFSHGVPIGYGGASPLFHQANTGVSVLEEFRGGESRFLFLQVLRVFHSLFGSDRFIANPRQFGEGNDEALATGAFWFYYKLGFRPTKADVKRLAQRTAKELRSGGAGPTDRATMKRLISCDLELIVTPRKAGPRFEEQWLSTLATAATKRLAEQGTTDRGRAARIITNEVASWLGVEDPRRWPADERRALERLAPLLAVAADGARWPASAKRECADLIRAKGQPQELDYVRKLARHRRLREALASIGRGTSA